MTDHRAEVRGVMADEQFVYRTTKPEVVALEASWREAQDAYEKASRAFKRKHPIKGAGGKLLPLLETRGHGRRVVGYQFFGNNAPEGWRIDRKNDTLTPKRSNKIGKTIAADMDKCSMRDLRQDLHDFGMVTWTMGEVGYGSGIAMLSPGVAFMEGACWVSWSKELKPGKGGYDPDIWEPVKLSEFYAAKERADAAA